MTLSLCSIIIISLVCPLTKALPNLGTQDYFINISRIYFGIGGIIFTDIVGLACHPVQQQLVGHLINDSNLLPFGGEAFSNSNSFIHLTTLCRVGVPRMISTFCPNLVSSSITNATCSSS